MVSGINNEDNVPSGNNSDNDDSTEAQNYSDGPLNVLKKLLKIESVADAPICAAAEIQTIDSGKQEDGAVSLLRKIKSIQGLWFSKTKKWKNDISLD